MGLCVGMSGNLMCSFGTTPASLMVDSQTVTMGESKLLATIMDFKPNANIPPFGMCNSPANPATVKPPPVFFAPAPCVPVIPAPWAPGSPTVLIKGFPALNNSCSAMCAYGGKISIANPGQTKNMVP